MECKDYFPVWEQLTKEDQLLLQRSAVLRHSSAGTILHNGNADCVGLFIVCTGQLRAFILSEEGREITLYRLFERDMCLFSASCLLHNIQFDITIEAERDCDYWLIPPDVFQKLMHSSLAVSNYTNELMASRFSDVMWLIEQILWKSFDKRLSAFLLEESNLDGSPVLKITHEKIAAHLGTAREVVTRMLRYFQSEGMVSLTRGTIELTDLKKLQALAG